MYQFSLYMYPAHTLYINGIAYVVHTRCVDYHYTCNFFPSFFLCCAVNHSGTHADCTGIVDCIHAMYLYTGQACCVENLNISGHTTVNTEYLWSTFWSYLCAYHTSRCAHRGHVRAWCRSTSEVHMFTRTLPMYITCHTLSSTCTSTP